MHHTGYLLRMATAALVLGDAIYRNRAEEQASFVRHAERPLQASMYAAGAAMGLGLVAIVDGERRALQAAYDRLVASSSVVYEQLIVDRFRGMLAFRLGMMEEAERHLRDAIAFAEEHAWRPERAWSLSVLADCLAEKGDASLGEAQRSLANAASLATDLGMTVLADRIAAQQEALPPGDAQKPPAGLTDREVLLLRHLAQGLTNQEIGDRMSISAKTVANHITRIFEKTGAGNRTEAAAFATRHGLVELR